MTDTDNILLAVASIDIEARGDSSKPVRVAIAAYNGGLMQPPGWPQLAIELSGVTHPESVPLLADHQSVLAGIVGHGRPVVRDGKLLIEGTLSDATEAGKQVLALARSGFPFQASIGLKTTQRTTIRAGESAIVNGQSIKAPDGGFVHVLAGVLQEVSILPLGADSSTSVSVAASQRKKIMADETQTELTPEQVERERVAEIVRASREYAGSESTSDIMATAIEEGWDSQRAELEMLRASRPVGPPNIAMNHRGGGYRPTSGTDHIEASILRMAGLSDVAVSAYGEQVVYASERISSLRDVCGECLRAEGRHVPNGSENIIKAAFSTESLPTVLSNTVGRSMIKPFLDATSNWRTFATVKSAANFKPQKSARPSSFETLEEVGPAGEIKHSDLAEDGSYDWSIDTFARMIGVTRQTIINDDLGFISEYGPLLGQAAGRSLNDLVYSTLMGGVTAAFFSSGNANYLEAGSDLDIASLDLAVTTMRKQRDQRGYDIDVRPTTLVVPPELETTAAALLNSTEVLGTSGVNGNPVRSIVPNLEVESRLSNTDRFSGASTDAWYLFASPMSHALIVGFLGGKQTPTVETEQAPFNTLGIQLRVYHDYGVALGDHRGAVKATGASAG